MSFTFLVERLVHLNQGERASHLGKDGVSTKENIKESCHLNFNP